MSETVVIADLLASLRAVRTLPDQDPAPAGIYLDRSATSRHDPGARPSGIASRLPSGIASGMLPGMTDETKVQENRLRRAAERQSLQLVKSRRRDPRSIDYGTYMLVDIQTNSLVAGERMQLEDVDDYLTG